jgi:NADPH-dependent glutamate synthase beta subunit-like oxidoreductase
VVSNVFEELSPALSEDQALLEADRCLECGGPHAPAPCSVACPAGIDIASFVASIADGKPADAAATIFAENLLGGTCARVCLVEALCVGACVLPEAGRAPIPIGLLQRYATDWAFAHGHPLRARIRQRHGGKVAVIGAGPAGLVCAGETAALGHGVTVFDEREEPGGLVRYAIAPYRQLNEASASWASTFASVPRSTRRAHYGASKTSSTRSSSASGWAAMSKCATTATSSRVSGPRCRSSKRSRPAQLLTSEVTSP